LPIATLILVVTRYASSIGLATISHVTLSSTSQVNLKQANLFFLLIRMRPLVVHVDAHEMLTPGERAV
jgi:hypothetical protein